MTEAELDAIEARCRAATEGPWNVTPYDAEYASGNIERMWDIDGSYPEDDKPWQRSVARVWGDNAVWLRDRESDGGNAAFIAHARTDVPALVAEVRRLRAERDAALAEVARLTEALDAAARLVKRKADRAAGKEEA